MQLLSSLHDLVHQFTRTRRRHRPPRRQRAATFRPSLEVLEDRAVPATITWTGAADSASWQTPGNWDLGRVPGAVANDDVVIPDVAATTLITYATGSSAIRSLTSQEAILLSGGTLTIGATGAVSAINRSFTINGGTLAFDSTTVNGSGTLTNTGTMTLRASGNNES